VEEALRHPYFKTFRNEESEITAPKKIVIPISDNTKLTLKSSFQVDINLSVQRGHLQRNREQRSTRQEPFQKSEPEEPEQASEQGGQFRAALHRQQVHENIRGKGR